LIPTDLGGWFGRWFRVFGRSFWRLSLITLIVDGVLLAMVGASIGAAVLLSGPGVWDSSGIADTLSVTAVIVVSTAMLIGFVVCAWGQGASLYLAAMDAAGRHARIGEALRFGVRRASPLVGWYLLAAVAVVIGLLLLVIPGIYLSVVLNASLACAVVIERDGPGRCLELIRHRFWATFGRLILGGLITQAFVMAAQLVLAIPLLGAFALIPPGQPSTVAMIVILVLSVAVVLLIVLPVVVASHAMTLVTYAELRGHENRGATTDVIADELTRS
jgi:hypothetical protein